MTPKELVYHKQSGFTLVEVMIVMVILALMAALIVPNLGGRGNDIREVVNRLTVLGKHLQARARLEQKTFRLVVDMTDDEAHTFYVESTSGAIFIETEPTEEEEPDEEAPPVTGGFAMDPDFSKSPRALPDSLMFADVEVSYREDPITEGRAYVHFFPQGMVEEVVIHITDGENLNWSITYAPLTGKGHVLSTHVRLRDLRG